jgi:hypothetical protein
VLVAGAPSAVQVASDASEAAQTEVWIGELRSASLPVCYPKDSAYAAAVQDANLAGETERVVLIVEYDRLGKLGGRVQFGQDPVPTDPSVWAWEERGTTPDNWYWFCTSVYPASGAEYSVLNPVRTQERFTFEVATSEVWDAWCKKQHRTRRACKDKRWLNGSRSACARRSAVSQIAARP